jgi:hypothetical protein
MKKKYSFSILFIGIFLILFISCQPPTAEAEKEKQIELKEDSLPQTKLAEGQIPKDWEKIELGKGYFVAFPEKPKKRTLKTKKRTEYSLSKEDYILYCSYTDLEEEPLFQEKRAQKGLFYDAVLKDLMEELAGTSESGALPQLVLKEDFLFLNIYEAVRAELRSEDFIMELKTVVVGKQLFTTAFIVWEEPEGPAVGEIMTLKKDFFHSFGKELYIK